MNPNNSCIHEDVALCPNIVFRQETFGGLVFNRRWWHIMEVNHTGYDLLRFLESNPTKLSEILLWASNRYTDFKNDDRDEIIRFLEDLCKCRILQGYNKGNVCNITPNDKDNSRNNGEIDHFIDLINSPLNCDRAVSLSAPISVWWDITAACNYSCKQCYSASGKPLPDELNTEEVLEVLEQLASMNVFFIYFLGGEPFMRRDFLRILSKCGSLGISVMVNTNGSLITRDIAKELVNSGVFNVRVSVDGASPHTHDEIRGVPGSFYKAVNAINYLVEAGIPRVGLVPTIMDDNYNEAEAIIDLAYELKVHEIQVGQLCQVGRGQKLRALNIEQIKGLRDLLKLKCNQYRDSMMIFGSEGIWEGKAHYKEVVEGWLIPTLMGCGAGRSVAAIGPSGKVRACLMFQYEVGDLRKKSFKSIWDDEDNMPIGWLRANRSGCEECRYRSVCAGPCHIESTVTKADRKCFVNWLRKKEMTVCRTS